MNKKWCNMMCVLVLTVFAVVAALGVYAFVYSGPIEYPVLTEEQAVQRIKEVTPVLASGEVLDVEVNNISLVHGVYLADITIYWNSSSFVDNKFSTKAFLTENGLFFSNRLWNTTEVLEELNEESTSF